MTSMPSSPSNSTDRSAASRVTVKEVAARAGVSAMTVSRVVNAPESVSPELRAQVQQVIDELGYIPNNAAVGFRTTRSRMVGFLMPNLSVHSYRLIHAGLTDVLEPKGYSVLVAETRYDPARESKLLKMLLGWRPSGIVRVPTGDPTNNNAMFQAANVPLCEFADVGDANVTYGVGYSHEAMGRDIGQHLIARGKRHIAVVMPHAVPRFMLQYQGVCQAAIAHPGVTVSSLFLSRPSPLTMEDGAQVIRKTVAEGLEHDALVFFSDVSAVGALLECQRQGIAVPGRLAIMGYGNSEMSSQIIPSLTSVQVDDRAIGVACASLLLDLMEAPQKPRTLVPVPYQLIARDST